MDISRYLAALIREKKELAVTGLGTFYQVQLPASYDAASNSFLPPTDRVSFKKEFSDDDTLLNYIATAESIDVKSAAQFLETYVHNLNDLLNSTESIKIDGLGLFERSGSDYIFEAEEHLIPANQFGLKPHKEIADTGFVQKEHVQVEIEEETEDATEPARSGQRVFWIFTILLVLILSTISLLYPDLLNSLWQKEAEPAPKPVKVSVKDTLTKADTTALADTSLLNTDSVAINPANSSTYEIIVAAFGKRTEADQYIKQLASRGISAHALDNKPKEFIKISVGTFTDEKLAQAELARIQSELSSTAWIHHIKTTKTP